MYDITTFRSKLGDLLRVTELEEQRLTRRDVAQAIGLSYQELSDRLNGRRGAKLSERDARAIVRSLTYWGAISTQVEAMEMLALVDCPSFTAAEWQSPPLARLTPMQSPPQPIALYRASQPKSNIPTFLTSFVGRKQVTKELTTLLKENRLITLFGTGGCGKTRLAVETVRQMTAEYPDGIFMVELAQIGNPELVPQIVSKVMEVGERAGQNFSEVLAGWIGEQQILLVLDNCEHLAAAVAELVNLLVSSCPHLCIMATSRERLDIPGEVEFLVPPLELPPAEIEADELISYEAIRLFVERTRLANSSFHLDEHNRAAVTEICTRLDGLPLAIELAAVRMRMMTAQQIATGLSRRFELLVTGERVRPTRQQTLRALVDWSYDLLSPEERLMFCYCAVFAGSFTMDAVGQVCSDTRLDGYTAINLLGQLIDKSLVQVLPGDEIRYGMLETIREYALEKLSGSGKEGELRRQHAEYYLRLAEMGDINLHSGEQLRFAIALDKLEQELNNIRAALEWASSHALGIGADLSAAMGWFWYNHGYLTEGRQWLEWARPVWDNDNYTRAKLLNRLGVILYTQAQFDLAKEAYAECLLIRRRLCDKRGTAVTLNNLGLIAVEQGDYRAAQIFYEECLAIYRELDNNTEVASTLRRLGNLAIYRGDYAMAAELIGDGLLLDQQGGQRKLQLTYYEQAVVWEEYGRLLLTHAKQVGANERHAAVASARIPLSQSLALYRRLEIPFRVSIVEAMLKQLEDVDGD